MKVSVILPAAGLGTRMKTQAVDQISPGRKQFLLLEGSPILFHTIRKFTACPLVQEVLVAVRADDLEWVAALLAGEQFTKPVRCVEGGDTPSSCIGVRLARRMRCSSSRIAGVRR